MPKVESVVFLSLVLDLFAFTIPLPLFPRIIEWYTKREISNRNGFLAQTLSLVAGIRSFLYKPSANSQRWDIVLLGGLMGSLFSTLQFIVSPWIGKLSDKYGRRNVLLITMIGNILSAVIWIQSTTFASYLLSRAVGGLSEGNVQLAIAILSDVTTPENRSKALAHVGIAFAICFIIGPPIGAYFASRPVPYSLNLNGKELNIYATPAILTLILLVAETVFLMVALPETRGRKAVQPPTEKVNGHANGHANGSSKPAAKSSKANVESRIKTLKELKNLHFWFLGAFSGVEFTLTFLTFDLFDWNNSQNGRLIGFIGIVSALLQGGYVRKAITKSGEGVMARRGIASCAVAMALMAVIPHLSIDSLAPKVLLLSAVFLAFTSATVVNSLTAYASLQCDEGKEDDNGKPQEVPQLAKGRALGEFRSSGQLGRAVGPLLACALYWTVGPSITYALAACAMTTLISTSGALARRKTVQS
ncbi:MFS, DHA1 sub-family [Sistotremastrum niveocremeum HHB9708]|uniref:MFS, DHA1 sub-family n=2 Tax=Sistotremastraceae TaxID=3402574 RepID=A0A164ZEZ0_9AGAM|nr:MFS, DHA1 sub-family [Sistotremastrum niveocremeum HHB9708]KZT41181.1 MFS general substrate transporter [Sistotremastrum suecicum HHB10207 ss-3]